MIGNAALACGLISVGTCNGEVTSTILQTMMERSESDLKETYSRYLALGLALAYLGEFNVQSWRSVEIASDLFNTDFVSTPKFGQ